MARLVATCSRDTERCEGALDKTALTPRCCVEGALETLRIAARLFDAHGVRWWVDYGTLLSLAGGGRFFWNDDDCGVGVLQEDRPKVFQLQPLFEAEGFRFIYERPTGHRFTGGDLVKIHWSETNDANTDVAFWFPRADGMMDRHAFYGVDQYKGREFPAAWLKETVRVTVEGVPVVALAQWEALGALRYGPAFRLFLADVRSGTDPVQAGRAHFPHAVHDGVRR